MENDIRIEQALRDAALRPADEAFTRRVLAALPGSAHARPRTGWRNSLVLSMRIGLALAMLVVAQRWYLSSRDDAGALLALLLFLAPAIAATSRLCGPWIPRDFRGVD